MKYCTTCGEPIEKHEKVRRPVMHGTVTRVLTAKLCPIKEVRKAKGNKPAVSRSKRLINSKKKGKK